MLDIYCSVGMELKYIQPSHNRCMCFTVYVSHLHQSGNVLLLIHAAEPPLISASRKFVYKYLLVNVSYGVKLCINVNTQDF